MSGSNNTPSTETIREARSALKSEEITPPEFLDVQSGERQLSEVRQSEPQSQQQEQGQGQEQDTDTNTETDSDGDDAPQQAVTQPGGGVGNTATGGGGDDAPQQAVTQPGGGVGNTPPPSQSASESASESADSAGETTDADTDTPSTLREFDIPSDADTQDVIDRFKSQRGETDIQPSQVIDFVQQRNQLQELNFDNDDDVDLQDAFALRQQGAAGEARALAQEVLGEGEALPERLQPRTVEDVAGEPLSELGPSDVSEQTVRELRAAAEESPRIDETAVEQAQERLQMQNVDRGGNIDSLQLGLSTSSDNTPRPGTGPATVTPGSRLTAVAEVGNAGSDNAVPAQPIEVLVEGEQIATFSADDEPDGGINDNFLQFQLPENVSGETDVTVRRVGGKPFDPDVPVVERQQRVDGEFEETFTVNVSEQGADVDPVTDESLLAPETEVVDADGDVIASTGSGQSEAQADPDVISGADAEAVLGEDAVEDLGGQAEAAAELSETINVTESELDAAQQPQPAPSQQEQRAPEDETGLAETVGSVTREREDPTADTTAAETQVGRQIDAAVADANRRVSGQRETAAEQTETTQTAAEGETVAGVTSFGNQQLQAQQEQGQGQGQLQRDENPLAAGLVEGAADIITGETDTATAQDPPFGDSAIGRIAGATTATGTGAIPTSDIVDVFTESDADPELTESATSGGLFAETDAGGGSLAAVFDPTDAPDGSVITGVTGVSEEDLAPDTGISAGFDDFIENAGETPVEEGGRPPSQERFPEQVVEGTATAASALINPEFFGRQIERTAEVADPETAGMILDEPGTAAETGAAVAADRVTEFGEQFSRDPGTAVGGAAFTALTAGAAGAAAGRGALSGSTVREAISAELDPRVGPFGETIETSVARRIDPRTDGSGADAEPDGGQLFADDVTEITQEDIIDDVSPIPEDAERQRRRQDRREQMQEINIENQIRRAEQRRATDAADVVPDREQPRTVSRRDTTTVDVQPGERSRSGPTASQREAGASRRTGTFEVDLSPRERQLAAQATRPDRDFRERPEVRFDSPPEIDVEPGVAARARDRTPEISASAISGLSALETGAETEAGQIAAPPQIDADENPATGTDVEDVLGGDEPTFGTDPGSDVGQDPAAETGAASSVSENPATGTDVADVLDDATDTITDPIVGEDPISGQDPDIRQDPISGQDPDIRQDPISGQDPDIRDAVDIQQDPISRDDSLTDPDIRDPDLRDPDPRDPDPRDPDPRDPDPRDPDIRDPDPRDPDVPRDDDDDDELFFDDDDGGLFGVQDVEATFDFDNEVIR